LSGGSGQPEIIQTAPSYSLGANPVLLARPITGNNRTTVQWYLYPDPQATRIFAQAVANRYNGQNGHGTIQALEIGNEEYDSANSNGGSVNAYNDRDARYYINVLPVVAPAIRATHPSALIGMCPIWWNQLPHAHDFLNAIYQASPTMKENFDYVNFHFYPFESGASGVTDPNQWVYAAQPNSTVPSFAQEWQALQTVMEENGDGGKDIHVTEFGWFASMNQSYRNPKNLVSEDSQAKNYISLFESARLSGVVSHVFFWTLDYAPNSAAMHRDSAGNPISDDYSLAQVQYVNGQPQTRYTQAFTAIKNYIARYPQWNTQPNQPPSPPKQARVTYQLPQIIQNDGNERMKWNATSDQPWCIPNISGGFIEPRGAQHLTLLIDVSALNSGTYTAHVTVNSDGGGFIIPVPMTIP
jgi:hypothetical protein